MEFVLIARDNGKGPSYSYTPDGKLARRIWARGIVTDYTYDSAGNLTRKFVGTDPAKRHTVFTFRGSVPKDATRSLLNSGSAV